MRCVILGGLLVCFAPCMACRLQPASPILEIGDARISEPVIGGAIGLSGSKVDVQWSGAQHGTCTKLSQYKSYFGKAWLRKNYEGNGSETLSMSDFRRAYKITS